MFGLTNGDGRAKQALWQVGKRSVEDIATSRLHDQFWTMFTLPMLSLDQALFRLCCMSFCQHCCLAPFLSSWNEHLSRTGIFVKDACSSSYSEWNADETWSSQEWKSDDVLEARTRRFVNEQPADLFTQHTDIYCWWRWMIQGERCWTNLQKMQHNTVTNILYGECLCFQHWKHLFHGKGIFRKVTFLSKIQGSILQWNRCLTYLKSWESDNQMRFMESLFQLLQPVQSHLCVLHAIRVFSFFFFEVVLNGWNMWFSLKPRLDLRIGLESWSKTRRRSCSTSKILPTNPTNSKSNSWSRKTWSVFKRVHLKTVRVSMLSRLMIDQGNLVKTQLQYKTTLKNSMRPKRSTITMRQFVKELRQTWTSKFQDYHILLWSTRKVPAFEKWVRKLRTTQIDMFFNETCNRVNHLILSVQNQNKWFMKMETLNCVNCSRRNHKRSPKYVDQIGTLALSTARAGISCVKEE